MVCVAQLLFFVFTMGESSNSTTCRFQNPSNIIDFVMNVGLWYLQLKYTLVNDGGLTCVEYDIDPHMDDGFYMTRLFRKPGSDLTESVRFSGHVSGKVDGEITVVTPERKLELIILDTDYDNYTILYSCMEENKDAEEFWILTRDRNPKKKTMDIIYTFLRDNKIDRDEFVTVDQTNCGNVEITD